MLYLRCNGPQKRMEMIMVISSVTGRLLLGTPGADNLTGGSWNDVLKKMTADEGVTDLVDGGLGSDTIDYSSADFTTGVAVNITLTDAITANGASGGAVTALLPDYVYVQGKYYEFV